MDRIPQRKHAVTRHILCRNSTAGIIAGKRGDTESGAFPVTAVLCFLSAMSGGLLTARQSPWGTLPSALLNTLVFAGILIAAGAICWQGITWYGHGSILLLCALAGGVVAGILGGRRSHRRKRK